MKPLVCILTAALLYLSLPLSPPTALAAPSQLHVSTTYTQTTPGWGTTHFSHIQTAINAAPAGSTITVSPGTYPEHITVDKTLTLRAATATRPIIDGGGIGNVLLLNADNITIDGFEIANGDWGIEIASNDNTITNCTLSDNAWRMGIPGHNNTITNNTFTGKGEGIGVGGSHNTITNNTFIGAEPGGYGCTAIRLVFSSHNLVADNRIENFRAHILLTGSDHNIIANNTISRSWPADDPNTKLRYCGIILYGSQQNHILNNSISTIAGTGIRLFGDSTENTIQANTITKTGHAGIDLYYGAHENQLINNRLTDNTYGILLDQVRDNLMTKNSLTTAYDNGKNTWTNNHYNQHTTGPYNIKPAGIDSEPLPLAPGLTAATLPSIDPTRDTPEPEDWQFIDTDTTWDGQTLALDQPLIVTATLTITNTTIDLTRGISVWDGGRLILNNVDLTYNGSDMSLIDVHTNSHLVITDSRLTGRGQDITAQTGATLRIEHSELHSLGHWDGGGAIHSMADNAIIRNNLITGGYVGIRFHDSSGHQVIGNTITHSSEGIVSFGWHTNSSSTFQNNRITDHIAGGLTGAGMTNSIVVNNTFRDIWGTGIALLGTGQTQLPSANTVYDNSFINCRSDVYEHGANNWDHNQRGNYWDDHSTRYPQARQHSQLSGIWDTPRPIPGGRSSDRYPLINDNIAVYINNKILTLDTPPIILAGRTLAPMRAFFEALGAEVTWESDTRTAVGTRGTTTVRIPIDSTTPTVNGQPTTISVPAQIINGRTYIPLRFVGEALGDTVNWDGATRTITIQRRDPDTKATAMFRANPARTGSYDSPATSRSGLNHSPVLAWRFSTGDFIFSTPAVTDDTVYFGGGDKHLHSLDLHTGQQNWSFDAGSFVRSSPLITDSAVIFGSHSHKVFALDPDTGDELWRFDTGGGVESSPAVKDQTVYVGSHDGSLYALDLTTGSLQWSFSTNSRIQSSPAVSGGAVYVGSDDGHMYSLSAATGEQLWKYDAGRGISSSPAVYADTVYFGGTDGVFYAIDAHSGQKRWTYRTAGVLIWSSPAVYRDTVYFGAYDSNIYALSTDGELKWRYWTGTQAIYSSPALADGILFVGSNDGQLYAVDAGTGERLWTYATGNNIEGSPVIHDGYVLVGSYDGYLYALKAEEN